MERKVARRSVWRQIPCVLAIALLLLATLFIDAAYSHVPGVMPYQTNAEARIIHVPGAAPTIQEAIRMAEGGDTIQIAPGLYEEHLIVDKGVTLRGAGEETVVWNVMAAGPEEFLPTISIETERASEVTLEQLTVILPRLSWCMRGQIGSICLDDRSPFLCPDAVSIRKASKAILSQVHVVGHNGFAFQGPQGIRIREEATVTLEDTDIHGIEGDGLLVSDSAQATLDHVEISESWLNGLRAEDGGHVTVRDSAVADNGTAASCREPDTICSGVHIADQSRLTLSGVDIRGNTDWGLSAQLECCGFADDCRSTRVMWQGPITVEGNNTSHNHDGFENPGNHPFTHLPDGQVCLP